MLQVSIVRDPSALDLPLPAYATPGSAGLDLRAALDSDLVLAPGARVLVSTGIRIALPENCEAQLRPRSGLALKHGLTLLNSPGTIDSDYRSSICVLLINLGQEPVTLRRGDRIAQLVVAPILKISWNEVSASSLPQTERGVGSFGSTGV